MEERVLGSDGGFGFVVEPLPIMTNPKNHLKSWRPIWTMIRLVVMLVHLLLQMTLMLDHNYNQNFLVADLVSAFKATQSQPNVNSTMNSTTANHAPIVVSNHVQAKATHNSLKPFKFCRNRLPIIMYVLISFNTCFFRKIQLNESLSGELIEWEN